MKTAALLGVLGATTLLPVLAFAEDDAKPAPVDDKGTGTDVELGEDPEPPPEDMDGTSENPDAPKLIDENTGDGPKLAPAAKRTGYPIEEVLRPLTLPAVTSEVGLDVRARFKNTDIEFGLVAEYGITRQWQIGLRYGIGGLFDADGEGTAAESKFQTGKAFGLDVTYLVKDWLAARVSLPVYVDPFAMGMVVGAPMKFRLNDKIAFLVAEDFLEIKFSRFIPSLRSEAENTAAVAVDMIGTELPNANLRLGGAVIYQIAPDMAFRGDVSQRITDAFGGSDTPGVSSEAKSPFGIGGQVQYSPSPRFDVVGGLAIDDMTDFDGSFNVKLAAAFRI